MAKPNLAYIPATIGNKVYSILPNDSVGDFDFDRASTATRINAQGLIEEVASGENRLNYSLLDGEVVGCPHLLLEPQSTNLVTYSEDFSQWTNTRSSDLSGFISPTGENNATKFISDTTASSSHIIKSSNLTISSGQTYTYSVFVKANQLNYVRLLFADSSVSKFLSVYFNLTNGTVGTTSDGSTATLDSSNIENFGNGWFRCSVTGDLDTTTTAHARIYLAEADNDAVIDGDGTSSIYIWGAMVETGSYPTSYIKSNSGSATTRAAETCNGSGNAATFNDSEGVLMAEISAFEYPVTQNNWLTITDGSINNSIGIVFENTGTVVARHEVGGVNYSYLTHTIDYSNVLKVVFKYKLNDLELWVNGFKVDTLTSSPIFPNNTLDSLQLQYGGGSNTFYGNTKQLQYFDSILDSEQLEQLTSWDSFRAMAEGQLYTIE